MNEYKGNIGYLFSKLFFKKFTLEREKGKEKITFQNFETHTKALEEQVLLSNYSTRSKLGNKNFELITTYPGLLIGSGYAHDVHGDDGLKLGFYFDYTTGLPVLPGSSVKGVLRSAFEQPDYIEYIIGEIKTKERNLLDPQLLSEFEALDFAKKTTVTNWGKIIFEGLDQSEKTLPITKRDIFFDAYPIVSNNKNSKILATDYITPHADNPLKNPNPIKFLKVLPEVKYRFDFHLSDLALSASLKRELFYQILLDLGIGAKTNVGYGQFIEPPKPKVYELGQQLEGELISINERENRLLFKIKGVQGEFNPQIAKRKIYSFSAGKIYNLIIKKLNEDGTIKFVSPV